MIQRLCSGPRETSRSSINDANKRQTTKRPSIILVDVNRCGRSMTNSGLRTIYFKYNRSIHWTICYGRSEGDARGVPSCFPYVERGETDAKCNPYNVTPKRARNSNIMDSVSPHRAVIHARCISPCMLLYCRFQPSLLIRHDGERAGKTYRALAPSCLAPRASRLALRARQDSAGQKGILFRTERKIS